MYTFTPPITSSRLLEWGVAAGSENRGSIFSAMENRLNLVMLCQPRISFLPCAKYISLLLQLCNVVCAKEIGNMCNQKMECIVSQMNCKWLVIGSRYSRQFAKNWAAPYTARSNVQKAQ
jgi:hypothetical protein